MDRKFLKAVMAGWLTMFVTGYLIFDVAMASFYETYGTIAFGVGRDAIIWPANALGVATLALLIGLCLRWSGTLGAVQGFKVAGLVGFLVWFGTGVIYYGHSEIFADIFPIVDASLELVRSGCGGAVMAMMLEKTD